MIVARFKARLPPEMWIADVSEAMPDATFRLLSGVQIDDGAVELGEAISDDPEAIGAAVADHGSIYDISVLATDNRRVLSKYVTTDTELYDLVSASSLPVEFPVVVRDGWYELDLTGTRDEFEAVRQALDASGRAWELLSLVHDESPAGIVTERQEEVLNAALRKGYFEVPRECTLAELAAAIGIDKSTTSRILRRGASQVLQWCLTGGGAVNSDLHNFR
ncbi:helix-turn-helix domain-containing protein [Halovenus salina]|nr:helix-turn-helix domain-containing protein [Halovenus salina]